MTKALEIAIEVAEEAFEGFGEEDLTNEDIVLMFKTLFAMNLASLEAFQVHSKSIKIIMDFFEKIREANIKVEEPRH
jgi:hypothetical protein